MASITQLSINKSNVPSTNAPRMNVISALLFLAPTALGLLLTLLTFSPVGVIIGALLGLLAAQMPKIAKQWERAVVLRLGRYVGLRGPGLFWIIPLYSRSNAKGLEFEENTILAANPTGTTTLLHVNLSVVKLTPESSA